MYKDVYGYVYMVKNLVNGKLYFGITVNDFQRRYTGNIAKYTHNDHLRNSINTYGIENFDINEQFDVAYNEDDLWDLEDMYICLYNTLDDRYGYNKRRSGSKHKGHGKASEESRHKNSETNTKTWANKSEEEKKQHGEAIKQGIANMSEEEKKQMNEKRSEVWKNRSEEEKEQFSEMRSEVQTKVWANMSDEEKKQRNEKISEARKGNKNSNATKVICLETEQVFTTIKEAQEWVGAKSHTGISNCCQGNRKSAGKHPITGKPLHWMYYKDYLKLQNKEQDLVTC